MPWDRSPENHLTPAQRRDYLMASLGWFRDLLMLAFSLLLLVITGLSVTHSSFFVAPMDGARSVIPLSLIVIATGGMMFMLRFFTTITYRRALLSLLISLSVAFVIARGCIEGLARRDGIFLRTSKAGGRRTIFSALKLTRWETALAVTLYICVGLLATLRHPSWLLIFIVFVQATVYLCGPIAATWNLRAQTIPGEKDRRGFAERRLRAQRRRRALVPRPAAAALTALCVGGVTSAFVAPVSLLHATTAARGAISPQETQAPAGTEVYLELGSSTTEANRVYYPITSARLSNLTLSFHTSSLMLLGEVLRAAANGGRISHVSLAFRAPGKNGRLATEHLATFPAATVTSFSEYLSGSSTGNVSLLLPAVSDVTSTPDTLKHAGSFPGPARTPTARAHVDTGVGAPSYAVTAVILSQAAPGAPLRLSFTTSAVPLLQGIFQGRGSGIPVLTLSVRDGTGASRLWYTFSGLSVSSLVEKRLGSLSGTATLAIPPR